jgi:polysaccharide biosynthesis transport protein
MFSPICQASIRAVSVRPDNGIGLDFISCFTHNAHMAALEIPCGVWLSTCFDPGNSILITSPQPHEGKTTVACCLAVTALPAGQTALLIDDDLRRPWLASAAGIGDAIVLGEILEARAEAVEAIHLVDLIEASREAGPLGVMAARRKSPAFLAAVDWSKARTAFRSISPRFGIVFLDSPPFLTANDVLLLAGIVDGVILVVGAGSANRDEVQRARISWTRSAHRSSARS